MVKVLESYGNKHFVIDDGDDNFIFQSNGRIIAVYFYSFKMVLDEGILDIPAPSRKPLVEFISKHGGYIGSPDTWAKLKKAVEEGKYELADFCLMSNKDFAELAEEAKKGFTESIPF